MPLQALRQAPRAPLTAEPRPLVDPLREDHPCPVPYDLLGRLTQRHAPGVLSSLTREPMRLAEHTLPAWVNLHALLGVSALPKHAA